MNTKTLESVKAEVERFSLRLADIIEIEKGNEKSKQVQQDTGGKYAYTQTGTRKHGAVRRAALDLKEALTLITQNRDL